MSAKSQPVIFLAKYKLKSQQLQDIAKKMWQPGKKAWIFDRVLHHVIVKHLMQSLETQQHSKVFVVQNGCEALYNTFWESHSHKAAAPIAPHPGKPWPSWASQVFSWKESCQLKLVWLPFLRKTVNQESGATPVLENKEAWRWYISFNVSEK